MKNKNSKKAQVSYRLKLYKNKKTILDIRTTKKMRVFYFAQEKNWGSTFIKVRYEGGDENEGTYYNKIELKNAINNFTEESNIEYITGESNE